MTLISVIILFSNRGISLIGPTISLLLLDLVVLVDEMIAGDVGRIVVAGKFLAVAFLEGSAQESRVLQDRALMLRGFWVGVERSWKDDLLGIFGLEGIALLCVFLLEMVSKSAGLSRTQPSFV